MLSLLLLAIVCSAKLAFDSESPSCHPEPRWPDDEIIVDLNANVLYRFEFEEVGKPAKQNYVFYNPSNVPTYAMVWDCHCGGDSFALYINGDFFFGDNYGCEDANSQCNYQSDDPIFCMYAHGFCKIQFQVPVGMSNLTIVPLTSYYGKGYGYFQNLGSA